MTNEKFPITVDTETRQIMVGSWSADSYNFNFRIPETRLDLKKEILEKNGIALKAAFCEKKGRFYIYKEIAELLGASFNSRLRAVCLNVWISPIKDIAYKYCSFRRGKK